MLLNAIPKAKIPLFYSWLSRPAFPIFLYWIPFCDTWLRIPNPQLSNSWLRSWLNWNPSCIWELPHLVSCLCEWRHSTQLSGLPILNQFWTTHPMNGVRFRWIQILEPSARPAVPAVIKFLKLIAAFSSLLCSVPQWGHIQLLSDMVKSLLT